MSNIYWTIPPSIVVLDRMRSDRPQSGHHLPLGLGVRFAPKRPLAVALKPDCSARSGDAIFHGILSMDYRTDGRICSGACFRRSISHESVTHDRPRTRRENLGRRAMGDRIAGSRDAVPVIDGAGSLPKQVRPAHRPFAYLFLYSTAHDQLCESGAGCAKCGGVISLGDATRDRSIDQWDQGLLPEPASGTPSGVKVKSTGFARNSDGSIVDIAA